MIIALLIFVCCLPHALGGWLKVLNKLGVAASIGGLLITLGNSISNAIKNKEKDLEGLKKDLGKLQEQRDENRKAYEELLKEIETLEEKIADLIPQVNDAWQAMIAAVDEVANKTEAVEQAEAAYDAAQTNYNSHIMDCYECEHDYECYTADALYAQVVAAERNLNTAKRQLEIAIDAYEQAKEAHKTLSDQLKEARRQLINLEADKADLEEAHATLLKQIAELEGKIAEKEAEIEAAKEDLQKVENAEDTLPGYVASYIEAKEALDNDGDCDDGDCDDGDCDDGDCDDGDETDMEQWIEDNPPPESVAEFLDAYEEITEKYGD